jgi:uncharacterized FAD-dependent dehydrogenase
VECIIKNNLKNLLLIFQVAYKLPVQLLSDFVKGKVSTEFKSINPCIKGEYVFANLNDCLPKFASDSIKKALTYF